MAVYVVGLGFMCFGNPEIGGFISTVAGAIAGGFGVVHNPCIWKASSHTQQSPSFRETGAGHFLRFVEAAAYSCFESSKTVQVPEQPSARPRSVWPWPVVS